MSDTWNQPENEERPIGATTEAKRLDRIKVAFDDHRLGVNAGLILPVTLAHHLDLGELVDNYVDLGGCA